MASSKPSSVKSKKSRNKKIDKHHPEFELTYDMMLGIRTTVGQIESKPLQKLTPAAMDIAIKRPFPHIGSGDTPAHEMRDFKFKDYSPEVFRHIRSRFNINPADYLLCVCGNFQYLEFISNSKSGQFFFYTYDRQYMIKTITRDEARFLRKILPAYYHHIMKNPNTLLTRYYGMHRVKPHKKKEVHFLIMGSVFYTRRFIHVTFDLKGSKVGREATAKEKSSASCVFKDNDFLSMNVGIKVGAQRAAILNQQIAADVEFLRLLKIMDYSLLLGLHYKDRPIPDRLKSAAATRKDRKEGGRDSEGGLDDYDDELDGAGSGVLLGAGSAGAPSGVGASPGAASPATGTATLSSSAATANPSSLLEEKHAAPASTASSPSVPSYSLSPQQPSRSGVDAKSQTHLAVEEPPHSPRKKGRTRSYGGGGELDDALREHAWDRTRIQRANTAFVPDMHQHHTHAELVGDDSLQSNYGLPRRYNKISRPGDIKFKAPEFKPVEIQVKPAEVKQDVQRKNDIEPVQSLFTKEDGGVSSLNPDGSPGNELYYMGVIDILTEYGTKKKLEHGIKSVNHKSTEISAVNPSLYAERFKKFLKAAIS